MKKDIKRFSFRNRKAVLISAIVLSITSILLIPGWEEGNPRESNESFNIEQSRTITVSSTTPSPYPATFSVPGQALPEWQTSLRSQVTGEIVEISPSFHTGALVKKGDFLIKLEKSSYINSLAEAKVRVANARLSLLREKGEAEEALRGWKDSGNTDQTPSELLMRKPQLKVAEEELKASLTALKRAERELEYTTIRAPYDGIITSRKVSPGDTLMQGEEVAEMFSGRKVQITLYIKEQQMALLPSEKEIIEVTLHSSDRRQSWKGSILEKGSHIETDSRLIPLIAEVREPLKKDNPLLPGKFLTAVIKGRTVEGLLCINESSVTGTGHVWYIDDSGRLERYKPDYLFREGTKLYVYPPKGAPFPVQIALTPDSTYMRGVKAEAVEGE